MGLENEVAGDNQEIGGYQSLAGKAKDANERSMEPPGPLRRISRKRRFGEGDYGIRQPGRHGRRWRTMAVNIFQASSVGMRTSGSASSA